MPTVTRRGNVQIITREGEIKITLEIDININAGGDITVHAAAKETSNNPRLEQVEENIWTVPEFGPTEKLNFGKTIGE